MPKLPPRLRARKRGEKTWYYYDLGGKPRKERPLGDDYALALKQWYELEIAAKPMHLQHITFRFVAERYKVHILPTKAARTQRDNNKEFYKLFEFFDNPPAPLVAIKPIHVRQYLDWRGHAPVRANREIALFSHVWNYARDRGLTEAPNPCAGIERYPETGRDVIVSAEEFNEVWNAADWPTRDAMDLLALTGQRPGDVLSWKISDIRDSCLPIKQSKTGKKLRIEITGKLAAVIDRICARKYKITSLALVRNERGQPLTYAALDSRFGKARTMVGATWQLRDLRAMAGTEVADKDGTRAAQKLLGHATVSMTETYVNRRVGERVKPVK